MEQLNGIKREAKLLFPSVRYVGKMGGKLKPRAIRNQMKMIPWVRYLSPFLSVSQDNKLSIKLPLKIHVLFEVAWPFG